MNKEIAGKITSGVRGLFEVTAAVAKELNATSTIGKNELRQLREVRVGILHTWDATPQGSV
jgi:hypothetical protein